MATGLDERAEFLDVLREAFLLDVVDSIQFLVLADFQRFSHAFSSFVDLFQSSVSFRLGKSQSVEHSELVRQFPSLLDDLLSDPKLAGRNYRHQIVADVVAALVFLASAGYSQTDYVFRFLEKSLIDPFFLLFTSSHWPPVCP